MNKETIEAVRREMKFIAMLKVKIESEYVKLYNALPSEERPALVGIPETFKPSAESLEFSYSVDQPECVSVILKKDNRILEQIPIETQKFRMMCHTFNEMQSESDEGFKVKGVKYNGEGN